MVYIVIEIQSDEETASTIVNTYTNRNEAESKYHQILTSASLSNVPVHTAVVMTDTGTILKCETYRHKVQE